MNREIVVVQFSDGSGFKYEGLSFLEAVKITDFISNELGRPTYDAVIFSEPLIPVSEPDFLAGSTVHAVTQVGATYVFATAKDAATFALEEIEGGSDNVLMHTLRAPEDMTAVAAADWAAGEV